jgi:PHD/YefM family antitoxin component YafN of YafNO toxin-antitoxin module
VDKNKSLIIAREFRFLFGFYIFGYGEELDRKATLSKKEIVQIVRPQFVIAFLKKFGYNIFRNEKEDTTMPNIRSSTDLRNNYNEISTFCHSRREPVFITRNGQGDLAVMSIEDFELLNGKLELYRLLDEGRVAVQAGRKRPLADVMKDIKQEIADGTI